MDCYLELRFGDEVKHIPIDAEQVTVGSSPTAGIPLVNASQLEAEHFLVAPRREGCWVSVAEGAQVPLLLEGRALQGELVPWDAELVAGELRFTLKRGSPPVLGLFGSSDKKKPSKFQQLLNYAALIAGVGALVFAYRSFTAGDATLREPPPEPPELFANLAMACSEGDRKALADNFAYEALARMDRYPFDPEEGILSVWAHSRAIDCYKKLGDRVAARSEEQRRSRLIDKLTQDYRARRLQLGRAIDRKDWRHALDMAQDILRMIMSQGSSDYLQWLARIERRLILKIQEEEEAAKKKKGFQMGGIFGKIAGEE